MLQVRNIFFSLIFIFSFFNSNSQIWCRPGATWHYTHNTAPSSSAYTRLNYIKDTLISSKNCNKISYYTQGHNFSIPFAFYGPYIYTHVNGNVVYIQDVTGTTTNFDTLFNYGANIGDSWHLTPKSFTNCAKSKVTVTDTGHVFIQSQYLKWLKVSVGRYAFNMPTPFFFTDTIFERLGCVQYYFYNPQDVCPTQTDSDKGGPLRCYDDNQISGYKRVTVACNYFVTDVEENNNNLTIVIYPNPASENIFLSGAQVNNIDEVRIKNILGQEIKTKILRSGEVINISELQNGIYFLEIYRNNKLISTKKISKQ
ncbi:MAG: T9SS type A sorting domain-containing protein [Bacteroidia bacterium]|nr:T9SS type A sorting domain-containing protein [Bacteroidia bacterium]